MTADQGAEVTELRPGDTARAAAATALLNRELGDGLYRTEGLLRDAADPTAGVWVAGRGRPAGVAVARLLVPEDATYYERFGRQPTELFRGTVGSFEALAVARDSRRQGLGTFLTATSLAWMRDRGCSAVVTISWQSGTESSSVGVFRRLGFQEGPTVDRFYLDESVQNGWACPVCRGPCTCPATLFTLIL